MRFWLGTHEPSWLATAGVGLMVSHRRLTRNGRRRWPVAAAPWVLDSGGFTELSLFGRWTIGPAAYAENVRRFMSDIGRLEWAAPQDWMCEPFITAKTGLTVREHQQRTVDNLLELRDIAPDVPWMPVLQGFTEDEYLECVDLYTRAGVAVDFEPIVGIGSVCRRQGTTEAAAIIRNLTLRGLNLHGFGLKTQAVARLRGILASADSLAWSYDARKLGRPLVGCKHKSCNNCLRYALRWQSKINDMGAQMTLWGVT